MPHSPDSPRPHTYAAETPTLDPERMEMLRDLCLDAGQDTLRDMLSSWEAEAARHLAMAHSALTSSDSASLKAAAHAIKGSCGNLGIVRLAELGRLLEHEVEAPVIANELLAQMEAEFRRAQGQVADVAAQP